MVRANDAMSPASNSVRKGSSQATTDTGDPSISSRRGGSGASMMTNKVIFRRLPPTLNVEDFIAIISPLPEHRYFQFCKADYNAGVEAAFCRAYLGLKKLDDVYSICSRFDGYEFADSKGYMYPALVEFAPNQRIPDRAPNGGYQFIVPSSDKHLIDISLGKKPKKQNALKGSILDDDDFKLFCDKLTSSKSAVVAGNPEQQQVFGVEAMLKEIEDKHREDNDLSKKRSPLVEYVEQRRRGLLNDMASKHSKSSGKASNRASSPNRAGDRRAQGFSSASQQKKKKRDRRRERGASGAVSTNFPAVGSIKIATKPTKTSDGEPPLISKTSEEDSQQKPFRNRPMKNEQQKPQRSSKDTSIVTEKNDSESRPGRPQQQHSGRPQMLTSSRSSQKQVSTPGQTRSRDEDIVGQRTTVQPSESLRFVDNEDESLADDNGDRVRKQQRPSKYPTTRDDRKKQPVDAGVKRSTRNSSGKQSPSSSFDQREYFSSRAHQEEEDPQICADDYQSTSADKRQQTQKSSGNTRSLGRTLVFSRSIAAAQSSANTASTSRTVRFDPRRGNAPNAP